MLTNSQIPHLIDEDVAHAQGIPLAFVGAPTDGDGGADGGARVVHVATHQDGVLLAWADCKQQLVVVVVVVIATGEGGDLGTRQQLLRDNSMRTLCLCLLAMVTYLVQRNILTV